MTRTATDNATLMHGAYEAFDRGDVPAVVALMDDQIEWNEAEGHPWYPGRPLIGPQQVVDEVFVPLAEAYEAFHVQRDRWFTDGDTVIVQCRYRATKAQATGRPLDAQALHVWDLREGKVIRFQQYVDTRQLATVLGA
ncbi:nuclear transport factor 2 family protein [Modestobacter altitudinis]|uniref:nuclear transport factor 2 family protein n=1 Tax=Modestobacter altitudinis TaxID=2213158 RepID=UPI00110D015B|nr:nuclear transport factor 2 family protein [Modestobacter altitudinis]